MKPNTKTMNPKEPMRVAFVSNHAHGRATQQAQMLAASVADFLSAGGMKVEIEVISEETFELRARVKDLERRLGIRHDFVVDEI